MKPAIISMLPTMTGDNYYPPTNYTGPAFGEACDMGTGCLDAPMFIASGSMKNDSRFFTDEGNFCGLIDHFVLRPGSI